MSIFNSKVGNGVHDDTEYIQSLLDSGKRCVHLPEPSVKYIISKPLKIHSNTSLVLDRFTEIMLAPQSNCFMLQNADYENGNENISIEGGIWNYNDQNQRPNPLVTKEYKAVDLKTRRFHESTKYSDEYLGVPMRFYKTKNLTLKSFTIKDPITFAIQMGFVEYFTIDDITFDFDLGNPVAANTDGVHIDGGCAFGHITNLKGTTYDDLVAINADDFLSAPISNITVDGIYTENCHSAVRLLSVVSPVKNISISNLYGTCFQYVIGITKHFINEGSVGTFSNIVLKNIAVSKCIKDPVTKRVDRLFPVIYVQSEVSIDCLSIENLSRWEYVNPVETIGICEDAHIGALSIRDSVQKNCLDNENYTLGKGYARDVNSIPERNKDNNIIPFIVNNGTIDSLELSNIKAEGEMLLNYGQINKITGLD